MLSVAWVRDGSQCVSCGHRHFKFWNTTTAVAHALLLQQQQQQQQRKQRRKRKGTNRAVAQDDNANVAVAVAVVGVSVSVSSDAVVVLECKPGCSIESHKGICLVCTVELKFFSFLFSFLNRIKERSTPPM